MIRSANCKCQEENSLQKLRDNVFPEVVYVFDESKERSKFLKNRHCTLRGCLNPGQSREAAELMILSRGQEKKKLKKSQGRGPA